MTMHAVCTLCDSNLRTDATIVCRNMALCTTCASKQLVLASIVIEAANRVILKHGEGDTLDRLDDALNNYYHEHPDA